MGKHKGYRWKSKVAVRPDGKAWYVSPPYPGLFHNMKIFKAHVDEHLACLVKEDLNIKESNNLSIDNEDNKNMRVALLDKGYKGYHKYGRLLTPKKKRARCDLNSNNKKK